MCGKQLLKNLNSAGEQGRWENVLPKNRKKELSLVVKNHTFFSPLTDVHCIVCSLVTIVLWGCSNLRMLLVNVATADTDHTFSTKQCCES